MKKRKILLDCDPGHDDALAILLAGNAPTLDLQALSVVAGNQTLDKTTKNTLNLVQFLNLDVPVVVGCARPIIRDPQHAGDIHGESGLDGYTFPPLKIEPLKTHAIDAIIETLNHSDEKITLVITGPMTNIALAIRRAPEIVKNIEEIVFMGGSYGYGNVSPAAEFNILCDPEAAHIVVNAGVKITMVGLDVTRKVLVLPEIIKRLESINNKTSDMVVQLLNAYNENQQKVFGLPGGPLHDPVTLAYLIDPSVLALSHVHLSIDLSHGESYGRTNCDIFNYQVKTPNAYVAHDIDVKKFWAIIEDSIKRYH